MKIKSEYCDKCGKHVANIRIRWFGNRDDIIWEDRHSSEYKEIGALGERRYWLCYDCQLSRRNNEEVKH